MGRNKNRRRKEKLRKWLKRSGRTPTCETSEVREKFQAAATNLRNKIDTAIQRLLEIGRMYDPLPILSQFAASRLFGDPDHRNPGAETSEAELEHLTSLFLSQPVPAKASLPSPEVIQECFDLVDSIKHLFAIYYYSSNGESEELRADLMIQAQFVRGEAYAYHVQEQFIELAQLHDVFTVQQLGFSSNDFLAFLRHAEIQINSGVNNRFLRTRELIDEVLARYKVAKGVLPEGERFDQVVIAINDPPFKNENQQIADELIGLVDNSGPPEVIEVIPRNARDTAIVKLLAAKFGDNKRFIKVPNWCGWPLNPSVIQRRPFIEREGRFYLPVGPLAFRNALSLFEGVIKDSDVNYWQQSFLPTRDAYLENKSVDLIAKMLPGGRCYRNLYYDFQDGAEFKRGEVDGLVLYDDALIVIETKAGKFTEEAKRGAPKRLQRDAKELLDVAFTQGRRLLKEIRNKPEIVLSDEKGKEILRLRLGDFLHEFIVTVSLEALSILQTNLGAVKKLGLIAGNEWPWAVCLNDLRVISDLTDHPSTFIHYLIRRIQANDVEELNARDELDLFGFYRAGQLFFPPGEKRDYTMMIVTGFTEEMDAYYDGLIGWGPKIPKPKQPILPKIAALLTILEERRPRHFLSACLLFLDPDTKQRKEWIPGFSISKLLFSLKNGHRQ